MAAIPHNNALLKKYKAQGLVMIGVCTSDRGQEIFAANARKHGIEYPAARDPELKTSKSWAVQYYPTYAVIDRRGIVRIVGLEPSHVEAVVKKLLAEPQSPRQRQVTRRSKVQASGSKKRSSHFVPIALRDSSASPDPPQSILPNHGNSMRIELPNGVVVQLTGDLDGQRLGDVIIAAGQIRRDLPGATSHGLSQHEVLSC